ncbi:mitochondrial amidoxime reducing component 2-like isoform X2 [Sitophilus oryzae]|uniref:Mitochondrial amidoxime reducing component 2-like isoform X2 n=1 Tax=Sitophilus oryzae TaxID=7048 RepID=A0A6J2X3K8_SITOR|nr:mitochondrial amidoxime reducing component 2-like isoform X2 [Sitophilus oryzae]
MVSLNQSHITIAAGTVFLVLVSALLFRKYKKEKIPNEWIEVGKLKGIFLYPLKSGKGLQSTRVFCGPKGIREIEKGYNVTSLKDRSFLLYTSKDREVRTARQCPKAVLIEVRPTENGVIFSAPGMTDLFINVPAVRNNVTVVFGNEYFVCTDCGDAVATWLSKFLLEKDQGMRLGYGDGSTFRNLLQAHKKWAEYYTQIDNYLSGIFSDLAALHLINQASVDDVNEKLPENHKISFRNFRPNLLVEGPEAFEEDKWEYIKVGEVVAKVCLECLRCIETTVSQDGTMNKERQPLKTLEKYRVSKGPFKYPPMGLYLKVIKTGKLQEGDPVYVSKTLK